MKKKGIGEKPHLKKKTRGLVRVRSGHGSIRRTKPGLIIVLSLKIIFLKIEWSLHPLFGHTYVDCYDIFLSLLVKN
jgi:hypothetical protein